jgi:predicted lipoprotein with Yx(FWY)xxD motif
MTLRLRRRGVLLIAGVAGLALAALTGLALAKTNSTLGTASNASLGKTIVVDSKGLTVYTLKPETTHHLLCKKSNGCFQFWPPVKVKSAKARLTKPYGVKGKLGTLHRNGFFQVTLGGRPLYRFSGDSSTKGMATGEGIKTFGGTWHVIATKSSKSSGTTTTNTTPSGY